MTMKAIKIILIILIIILMLIIMYIFPLILVLHAHMTTKEWIGITIYTINSLILWIIFAEHFNEWFNSLK